MPMNVADFIADRLLRLGVSHVFGVGGANIEDIFVAVQKRRPRIRAILSKHEHAAGTAADAFARVGRGLGVVMVTSGGGAMNLVHALAEARASEVPVLAIVGEPPSDVQGRGAFQDTSGRGGAIDAVDVFRAVSVFCARVEAADEVPELLERAIEAALGVPGGPAVLLVSKDRQRAEVAPAGVDRVPVAHHLRPAPEAAAVRRAAAILRSTTGVFVIAGDGVAREGAQDALALLVDELGALVAVTPEGRDAFDNHDSRFVGVAGAMGHEAVAHVLADTHMCLVVGTRLPLLARMGLETFLHDKPMLSIGGEPPFVSSKQSLHLRGGLDECMRALVNEVGDPEIVRHLHSDSARFWTREAPVHREAGALTMHSALAALGEAVPDGSIVLVDAGNTGAATAHYLKAPRGGRWLLAMGMAGMGYTFGAAVGAACASGKRCTVVAGDGAFFMNGLDIHTAVEHALPIVYVVFDNGAHGMCLVRERLLLREDAGYNAFHRSRIGTGVGALFPRIVASDCRSEQDMRSALAHAYATRGPAVVAVHLPDVEIPPFTAFQQAAGDLTRVTRGEGHEHD